jgi:hypothetical protein
MNAVRNAFWIRISCESRNLNYKSSIKFLFCLLKQYGSESSLLSFLNTFLLESGKAVTDLKLQKEHSLSTQAKSLEFAS